MIAGHKYGPETRRTKYAVRDIDDILDNLQDEIERRELQDTLNVMIVSDHGMTPVDQNEPLDLDDIVDFNDIDVYIGDNALAMIKPEHGKEEKV